MNQNLASPTDLNTSVLGQANTPLSFHLSEFNSTGLDKQNVMRAASQFPGKGPTDVDDAPAR